MGQVIDLKIFRESRQVVRLDQAQSLIVQLRTTQERKRQQCMKRYKGLLFPQIDFLEWSEIIALNPIMMPCECGKLLKCEVPFATDGGEAAGVLAPPCSCGSERLNSIYTKFPPEIAQRYGFRFAKSPKKKA